MTDPLCQFAHSFPDLAASILHRDRHKRRNFREETITDVLMAGMTAFQPFGVHVDFPFDESKTGNDMDWEFVAPRATKGRRYLRLHIQAKRAIFKELARQPSYWFYKELDHEAAKNSGHGSQAQRLIAEAKPLSGCVPMYMVYHSQDALELADKSKRLPAIEGVNVMFADALAPILRTRPPVGGNGHWPVDEKKVEKWRPHFMPLSDLLCFGGTAAPFFYTARQGPAFLALWSSGPFSPGALADRLNARRRALVNLNRMVEAPPIEAIEDIPQSTLRAIEGRSDRPGRAEIERPRAIFLSLGGDTEWGTDQDA